MKRKEIIEQIKNKTNLMNTLKNEGKIEEAYNLMNEIELHEKELKILDKTEGFVDGKVIDNKANNKKSLANVIKNSQKYSGTSETSLVPSDDQKEINRLKVEYDSLQDLITVKKANASKGSYVVRNRGTKALAKVAQGTTISPLTKATFTTKSYTIEDYKGLIPVTSQFLEDTDANIEEFIKQELAEAGAEAVRGEVLTVLKTFSTESINSIEKLKALTIKGLDRALLKNASWIMGQSTLATLYTLKDSNGRFLVEPDLKQADGYVLFGKPIKVLSDTDMPDNEILFGDFKEAVYQFDLQQTTIAKSVDFGFDEDVVYFRAIERFDVIKNDDNAAKKITLSLAPSPEVASITSSRSKK